MERPHRYPWPLYRLLLTRSFVPATDIFIPSFRAGDDRAVVYHEANQTEIHIADQDPRAMSDLRAVPGWQLNLATQNTECDFQRLCERSPVGMCVLQDDRIRYANPAAASLLARHGVEWERESFLEALHPDDRDIFEDKIEQLADAESIGPAPIRCVHPDGTSADILIHASSLQYNDRPAVLMTLEDVPASRSGHSAIDDRLRFERLLADLSARFVNVPVEQIEPLIDDSLKQLVEFLGNDRSTLFEFCEDEQFIDVTHSFSVPGCDTFPLGLFPVDRLPWYIGQFRQGDEVFLRNVLEDLRRKRGRNGITVSRMGFGPMWPSPFVWAVPSWGGSRSHSSSTIARGPRNSSGDCT